MRFLFNGLSFFGKKLVAELASFEPRHSFVFYDTYTSRMEQLKFICSLPFADAVISMNGVSDESGSLNAVLAFKKKLLLLWQGTDVLHATQRAANHTLNKKYIAYAANYSVAPWLKQELNEIGVPNEVLSFSWFGDVTMEKTFKEMSAYTYIPEGREEFYGWSIVQKLAMENPAIPFYVAGTEGKNLSHPENVTFLGWLSTARMQELSVQSPVYLRFTAHDGYPHSVTQALACGNEVIWSMPFSHSHLASGIPEASHAFRKVSDALIQRGLERNEENIRYARENFNREKVLAHFLKTLTDVATR